MNITGERLIIVLAIGIAAGWLAGQIVEGTGLGLVRGRDRWAWPRRW